MAGSSEDDRERPGDSEGPPHRGALLAMVLFPFVVLVVIALVYGWLRR